MSNPVLRWQMISTEPGKVSSFYCSLFDWQSTRDNALNYEILSRLNPDHLTVVGDVNQSIFGFRGASCGLVDLFLKEHPNARVIRLERNYRSGQKILDLANGVVESCPRALVLTSAHGHVSKTEQVPLPSAVSESAYIMDWIRKRTERGTKMELSKCEISAQVSTVRQNEVKRC